MKNIVRGKKKADKSVSGTIRARVRGGLLEPLDRIELPEGKEVTITVLRVPTDIDNDAFLRSAGSWKGVNADKLIRNIYADRLVRSRTKPRL